MYDANWNCCNGYYDLKNYYILLADDKSAFYNANGTSKTLNQVKNVPNVKVKFFAGTQRGYNKWVLNFNANYRYVRIWMEGTGVLPLNEVVVSRP